MMQFKVVSGIDPRITETFLLAQDDVQDASVWFNGNKLRACVTLVDNSILTREDLRKACNDELGWAQTPKEIILVQSRSWAA